MLIIRRSKLYYTASVIITPVGDRPVQGTATYRILIPLASSQHNLYDIYLLLCVQCQTPDDGQRNCPKYVQYYSKNQFKKLVLLVGFIIRIFQEARSSECQNRVDMKNQLDVTFCILYFSSNSCATCFGQPCAHHQELTTA